MEQQPVDVIAVYGTDGSIKPLRLRMEDGAHQLMRIDIQEVISSKEVQYAGIEAFVFLCRAFVERQEWLFELKYTIRSHSWCWMRRIY